MKKSLLIILFLTFVLSARSQSRNFIDQPYLETEAVADTMVAPDKIYLSILITEKDTKGKISVEELENKMAEKLKVIGIDLEKQLSLSDLSSNFKKYFLRQQDILKAKAYSLVVYDALTAGKVIAGLEEINISNVNLEKTEYSKMDQLNLELKSKAMIKALKQARAMVKPLNQKIGKAIYISDLNSRYVNREVTAEAISIGYSSNGKQKFNPLDIAFEKIEVKTVIKVKFILE